MEKNDSIDNETKQIFEKFKNSFLAYVNRAFLENYNLEELIGGLHNVQIMLDKHRNHIAFISILIKIGCENLLIETLPWVYRSYHRQGFSYDYFDAEFKLWLESFEKIAYEYDLETVVRLYRQIISLHKNNIELAENFQPSWKSSSLSSEQKDFMEVLIKGDQKTVFSMSDDYFEKGALMSHFYKELVTPVMYGIGDLWEKGIISVGEEHLASSLMSRILARSHSRRDLPAPTKGKIIICSSANEFHELGAWMTANIFEEDGWDVTYLGSNTPVKDLESLMLKFKPQFLGLSVTMTFNLDAVEDVINRIRSHRELDDTKIILGGNIFSFIPELKNYITADYIAESFEDALTYASTVGQL